MLLRSSSTPILGSLLTSFSDSPNNNKFHDTTNSSLLRHGSLNKFPYHHYHQTGSINLAASCNSSPVSPSVGDISDRCVQGFRRAQSDGNLEGLAYPSCNNNEDHQLPKKFSGKSKCLMLETIPSFSFYGLNGRYEDEDEEEEEEEEEEKWSEIEDGEEEVELWGEDVSLEGNCFGISNSSERMVCSEEVKAMEGSWNLGFEEENATIGEKMYIAGGLGIDNSGNIGGRGGGDDSGKSHFRGEEGGDMNQTEEYYKKMLQENPGNPLFLKNYAQFLCQTKQDLSAAEEYYSRAILADPKDGELLSQYAKLVWELHHDRDRALSYFERAVLASPEDSYVHAAYASFLWQIEEDEDERGVPPDLNAKPPSFHEGLMASIGA